jgi:L-fuconolactonase
MEKDIADLVRCPNVVARLGGINMTVNGFNWHNRPEPPTSDDWPPPPETGTCTRSTNSVRNGACSRATSRSTKRRAPIRAKFTPEEKKAMFGGTATRVYRLPLN